MSRLLIMLLFGLAGAYLYKKSVQKNQSEDPTLTDDPFPFGVSELNGQYSIRVPLEDKKLYDKYFHFFAHHGFEGNGYCWEGHIIQILEKIDTDLLHRIEMDAEAGAFYAYAETRADQVHFVNLLAPIFQNLDELSRFVRIADKSRVYD